MCFMRGGCVCFLVCEMYYVGFEIWECLVKIMRGEKEVCGV